MQEGSGAANAPAAPPHRRTAWLALLVAVIALAIDTLTKALAVKHLQGRAPVHVIGSLLELTLTRNPGAAFSTGTRHTAVIAVIALVAAVVVLWCIARVRSAGWAWALGLLLAGVLGNLADRLFREPGPFRGHVVDFLALPHWPVFNVADICINLAALLILILALRGVRLDGRRVTGSAR
jgi:signal peptidase II